MMRDRPLPPSSWPSSSLPLPPPASRLLDHKANPPPRHWSLQAPGILRLPSDPSARATPSQAPHNAMPTPSPSHAVNAGAFIPIVLHSGRTSAWSRPTVRSKAISLPASPTLSCTDLAALEYEPIPLFSLDPHRIVTPATGPSPSEAMVLLPTFTDEVMDGVEEDVHEEEEDDDDAMDTADDGECAVNGPARGIPPARCRSGSQEWTPHPHVRSVSDSHNHRVLGRGLKRTKAFGKGSPGEAKIKTFFRTLKRSPAADAHASGAGRGSLLLLPKSASDPALGPCALSFKPFKRAGTPALGKPLGPPAPASSYFTRPGSFKTKSKTMPLAPGHTLPAPRGRSPPSHAARSILADAFERLSISPTPRPPVGMGLVDGGLATMALGPHLTAGSGTAAAASEFGPGDRRLQHPPCQ